MKTVTIAGTIGKDAVVRRTQGGDAITGFSVAVDDGYGENKSTIWFDVSMWGKRGENVSKLLTKGTKVTVSGELGFREHEGKTYHTVRANDLTLQGGPRQAQADGMYSRSTQQPAPTNDLDDDLPF